MIQWMQLTFWVLWVSNAALCVGQCGRKRGEQQSHVKHCFFHLRCAFSDSPFPLCPCYFAEVSFSFLTSSKRWFILTAFWRLLFLLVLKRLLHLSLSLLFRVSVLWLLPSCTSSSWRPSAGCWQKRGSPTWLSLAKWGRDSFASAFCASAGVSIHGHFITLPQMCLQC